MKSILEQLELHEGFRSKPYKDLTGHLSVGIGRNLDDKGISKEEAYYLCENDIKDVVKPLSYYDWFEKLSPIRKKVIIDMAFNLGVSGLLQFKNMIQCLKDDEYVAAANEMINSRWYRQHERWGSKRAIRLENMMRTGQDYKEE